MMLTGEKEKKTDEAKKVPSPSSVTENCGKEALKNYGYLKYSQAHAGRGSQKERAASSKNKVHGELADAINRKKH